MVCLWTSLFLFFFEAPFLFVNGYFDFDVLPPCLCNMISSSLCHPELFLSLPYSVSHMLINLIIIFLIFNQDIFLSFCSHNTLFLNFPIKSPFRFHLLILNLSYLLYRLGPISPSENKIQCWVVSHSPDITLQFLELTKSFLLIIK